MKNRGLTVLFPGSFNPIHIGHMALANYVLEEARGEILEFWLMASPRNPLKTGKMMLPDAFRQQLIRQLIDLHSHMDLCTIENELPSPSYTYNTVLALQQRYSEKTFALLIGADQLQRLSLWYRIEDLLPLIHLWVYPRPGYKNSYPTALPQPRSLRIFTDAPLLEVSSTYIRTAIAEGRSLPFFFPRGIGDADILEIKKQLKRAESIL